MVPLDHPLAQVEGANNAVFVEGDLVGQVLLVGQGAGGRPTASAVVGDLIDLARSIRRGVQSRPSFTFDDRVGVIPMGEVVTRAYYRIRVDDRAGVLAAIGQVLRRGGREHLELHTEGRVDPGQDGRNRDHDPPDRRRPPAAGAREDCGTGARARGLMLPPRLLSPFIY